MIYLELYPNQIRNSDLRIKRANTTDTIAPTQFAQDWKHRVRNGATVRVPASGVPPAQGRWARS
ncbi:hypothetical protein QL093DRAFT_1460394 [Fusarium oxysporum]|nr:hypothetical protein QL093DRAFT_1460394 [Fusarium oxysporum]